MHFHYLGRFWLRKDLVFKRVRCDPPLFPGNLPRTKHCMFCIFYMCLLWFSWKKKIINFTNSVRFFLWMDEWRIISPSFSSILETHLSSISFNFERILLCVFWLIFGFDFRIHSKFLLFTSIWVTQICELSYDH